MNAAQALAQVDVCLFATAGRPEHYPKAKLEMLGPTRGVIDGGPPEGHVAHPVIVLHVDELGQVSGFSVTRELSVVDEPMISLDDAMGRCQQILAAGRPSKKTS